MVSGGSRRTTRSAVRFTSRPCSRACSTTARGVHAQLDAAHQAGAARFDDDRVPQGQRAQPAFEVRAHRCARDRAGPCPSAAPGRTPRRGTPGGCRRTCCRDRPPRSSAGHALGHQRRAPRGRPSRAPCPPTPGPASTRAPGSRTGGPFGRGRICTSSAMRSVPVFAHTSFTARTNPSGSGRMPPSPRIGSAMIAAVLSPTAARQRLRLLRVHERDGADERLERAAVVLVPGDRQRAHRAARRSRSRTAT